MFCQHYLENKKLTFLVCIPEQLFSNLQKITIRSFSEPPNLLSPVF